MSFSRAPWWMYVVAASFLGHFGLQLYTASPLSSGPGLVGFFLDQEGVSPVVNRIVPGGLAERAGLRAGDRILAVNRIPLRRRVDWDLTSATFEVGRPVAIEIERDGRPVDLSLTPQRRSGPVLSRLAWLIVCGNLVTIALALVIAFRRPTDLLGRIGAWCLATASISIIPPIPGFASTWKHLPAPLGALLWVAAASDALFPAIFFTFFAVFPRPLFRRRLAWALVWTPALLASAGQLAYRYAMVYQPAWAPSAPALSNPVSFVFRASYVAGGLIALVVNYRRLTDRNERRRLRVAMVGTVVGWTAVGTLLGLTILAGRMSAVPLGSVTLLVVLYLAFPVSFAYAILRHRVFDFGIILRRGLQYALARGVLLTAVPALVGLLMADLLLHGDQPLLDILRSRGWVYLAPGGLAALAYVRRQRWLDALDRRFFRERYDAQRLLRQVVEEVRESRSLERAAPRAVTHIEAALHPEFVGLLAREPGAAAYRRLAVAPPEGSLPSFAADTKLMGLVRLLGKPLEVPHSATSWLQEQLPSDEARLLREARVELLVPIATGNDRAEALLVLGSKRSEEPYAQEDRELLAAIAASLALALERPAGAPAPRSDIFEECPECGSCYDSGAAACGPDGARLVPVLLPRVIEGRYRLERRLGRGGMGTVYAAADLSLERRVAVKVIRDDLVGSSEAAERFRREARAAASFAHPNVVTIHDFGVAAATRAFLVMELLEGNTLREALRRGTLLTTGRALSILRNVASALDAAHRRQLVHRDLKPENIFLVGGAAGDTAKVLDFGLAKFLAAAPEHATADTAPGARLGTLRYMSPEQWRGEEAQPSWDLWALAVVAHEMVIGAHPFADRAPIGVAPVFTLSSARLADAPEPIRAFFTRALASDLSARPQSVGALVADFEWAVGGSEDTTLFLGR